jgi:hypothetical protein
LQYEPTLPPKPVLDARAHERFWLHLATAGAFVQCMWHDEDLPSIATIMGRARNASVAETNAANGHPDQDLGSPPAGVRRCHAAIVRWS